MIFKQSAWILGLATALFSTTSYSQEKTIHFCGQHLMQSELAKKYPEKAAEIHKTEHELEDFTQEFIKSEQRSARSTYVIPIVFHIIHMNGEENISEAQILDAVRIINEDFSASNEDIDDVVPAFESIIGDADIEFRLARLDPSGNPTNGIDRIQSPETNVGDDGSKLNPWPRQNYLNIWVVDRIGVSGAAAYAYLPSGANSFPAIDGIIANHRYIGSIGTAFFSGRHTLSHEIGHVLNLRHPWGPTNTPGLASNCNVDDLVGDTPNTVGTSGSCNTSQVTCGSLDNVQNIMDYANNCDRMFTQGQVTRMHASLNSSVAQRNRLWTNQNLIQTGVYDLTSANFGAIDPTICEGDDVTFVDWSEYGAETWNWRFFDAETVSSTDENPTINYRKRGAHPVELNVEQGSISLTESKSGFVMVKPLIGYAVPYSNDFESTTNIPDAYWYNHERRTFNQFGWKMNSNVGFSGSKSIEMKNFNAPEELLFDLETATFDLSVYSEATLTFRYAHAIRNTGDGDRLVVYVSTDCGENWTPRFGKIGNSLSTVSNQTTNYTPSSQADWREETVTLDVSLLTDATQFLFQFTAGGGNNLFIDDINITGTFVDQAQLDYPYDGMQDRGSNTLLTWKPMPCDEYEVQIDTDPNFSNPTSKVKPFVSLTPSLDNTYEATGLTASSTYYWRVRLINAGVEEQWSEVWSFTVAADGVGINDVNNHNLLRVFPNPTSENVSISFDNLSEKGELSITDMFGRVVHHQVVDGNSELSVLDTQEWSIGLYVVKLSLKNKEFVRKLIVQH